MEAKNPSPSLLCRKKWLEDLESGHGVHMLLVHTGLHHCRQYAKFSYDGWGRGRESCWKVVQGVFKRAHPSRTPGYLSSWRIQKLTLFWGCADSSEAQQEIHTPMPSSLSSSFFSTIFVESYSRVECSPRPVSSSAAMHVMIQILSSGSHSCLNIIRRMSRESWGTRQTRRLLLALRCMVLLRRGRPWRSLA